MDSLVDSDHLPDSSGGFCYHFLPENLTISSQQSMFLQDLTADLKNGMGQQDEQKMKNAAMKSKDIVNNKDKAKRELKVKVKIQEEVKIPEKVKINEKEKAKNSDVVMFTCCSST
jgi:hypothetical protein